MPKAYLVRKNGPLAGTRHRIEGDLFRVGRDPQSDVLPDGESATLVSARHMEIRKSPDGYVAVDVGSTNGTQLNGTPLKESVLEEGDLLTLGVNGPSYEFVLGDSSSRATAKTQIVSAHELESQSEPASAVADEEEELLQEAVLKARSERRRTGGGKTMIIMRDVMAQAVNRSGRKFKLVITALVVALLGVSSWAGWTVWSLRYEMTRVDNQMTRLEDELESADNPERIQELVRDLTRLQNRALEIDKNFLYQLGARDREADFVEDEIRRLMADLGAEQYSIPKDFRDQVQVHLERYQGPNRPNVERALITHRDSLDQMRDTLQNESLPPDLAFIVLVESAFRMKSVSSAGAAGPWQFVPATARAYGLTVNDQVDERFDIAKSTAAACRYIRHLIIEFGSGSSVMLALAAYNFGPGKIKSVMRKVKDPIRQRSFWYLYHTRALPKETRDYIPKIVAAILIGRNPQRFGFEGAGV